MTSGALAAGAAMRMRSERRIVRTLREAGATSAASAARLSPGRLPMRGALRMLVRRGAVVETPEGLHWLDEAAYRAHRELRRSRMFLALFGIAALMIVLAAVTIAKAETPAAPRAERMAARSAAADVLVLVPEDGPKGRKRLYAMQAQ